MKFKGFAKSLHGVIMNVPPSHPVTQFNCTQPMRLTPGEGQNAPGGIHRFGCDKPDNAFGNNGETTLPFRYVTVANENGDNSAKSKASGASVDGAS